MTKGSLARSRPTSKRCAGNSRSTRSSRTRDMISEPLVDRVARVFDDDGPLSTAFDGFEPRPGQRRLADSVARVLEDGGTLVAEAGTGTGKTLAYLVPAVLSGKRVLISTGTRTLQDQIFYK